MMNCSDPEHLEAVRLGLLTHEEIHKLEHELRQARQDVFSEDLDVEAKASATITEIRRKLEPMWVARNRSLKRERDAAYMRSME